MSGKRGKALTFIYKPLGWFPVIIINAIAVWSYFAYVVILCFDSVEDPIERAIYLIFYHPFFLMFMISYWKAILTSPGYVPSKFYLTSEDTEKYESAENPQDVVNDIAKDLPIVTFAVNKSTRFCEPCHMIKPDRSHHCSMCQRCVLKMDHHCPWVNNCVGWGNYKYFVLFLFYSILYTMYITFTTLKYFIKFWGGNHMDTRSSLHILFLFFVAAMFSVSLWSLFGFHCFLTLNNRSTLESFRGPTFQHGPDKNGFNLGKMNNVKQVFGNSKWKWILPVFTTLGNGVVYRTATSLEPIESNGLLQGNHYDYDDDSASEKDTLLEHEQASPIYDARTTTASAFINDDTVLTLSDSEGEDVMFDLTNTVDQGNQLLTVPLNNSRGNSGDELT